jgi:pyrroline-5-carboxylate reductase
MRISFIGGGNMAGAILAGLHRKHGQAVQLHVVDRNADKLARFEREFGATHSLALTPADLDADIVVLAIKPQQLKELAAEIAPHLHGQLIVSVAAGVRTSKLAGWLGGYDRLVWAMPNTPAQVGAGMTGLYATPAVDASQRQQASTLFEAVGQVVWLGDEARMDNLTAISGCGPAYVFLMVEGLTAAAQAQGFTPEEARQMAEQTFFGAVRLLENAGEDAASLRAKVTSKKGVTEQGILSMQADDLAGVIGRGVEKARLRSIELGELL